MATSCQDEALYDGNGNVIEGLPATVKLQIDLSEMDIQTRALVDDEGSNFCENVWVGMFQESSGNCIYSQLYTDPSSYIEQIAPTKYALALPEAMTESGNCFIVAVANVNAVEAISSADSKDDPVPLGNFLNENLTWEGFKSLCAVRSSTDDIYQLTYTLPMAGFYADVNSTENTDCEAKDITGIEPVAIHGGSNILTEAIHLRRLIAYNKFNIIPNSNMTVDLVSWQVCNNPYVTYVVEQGDNAGDHASGAYNPSLVSTSFTTNFDTKDGKSTSDVASYSFEFYQFENKRTACEGGIVESNDYYNQREKEYKNGTANTGIYQSLVSSMDAADKANNNASYVVLKARMSYYYDKYDEAGNPVDPQKAEPKAKADCNNPIKRTAEATYTIHLGYCENKDNNGKATLATAQDFNCRRNSLYTYNVYIKNVNNIVVEAYQESYDDNPENQPGMEGVVRDTELDYIEMDSHYNVFNIKLTNEDRAGLQYYITAPYNGTTYEIRYNEDQKTWSKFRKSLYSWIKFRPTTDMNTLAKYMATDEGLTAENLWSLDDLCDVEGHPNTEITYPDNSGNDTETEDDKKDPTNTMDRYYTVFIDEYVYHVDENDKVESGSEGTGYDETQWENYVNQDDRIVELATVNQTSNDKESHYLQGKYAFAQHSIQTYYEYDYTASSSSTRSTSGNTGSGLGVEHTNESYGLNYQWDNSQTSVDYYNGRYNLKKAVDFQSNNWNKCVSQTMPEVIQESVNKKTKMNNKIPYAEFPVPQLYDIGNGADPWPLSPSPDQNRQYYVNTACMNRNRDLNGNGIIDTNELRWFLPTYNQYVEVMIGLEGLVDPLIKWTEWPKDRYTSLAGYNWESVNWTSTNSSADDYILNATNTTRGRQNFHFASSDCNYIWADEGYSAGGTVPNVSSQTLYTNGQSEINSYGYYPYEIRCVRYLGMNPGTEPTANKSEVDEAYQVNANDKLEIDALHFVSHCLRPYVSTFLAPNSIESEINRPYKKFKRAKDVCKNLSDDYIQTNSSGYVSMVGVATNANNYDKAVSHWYQSASRNGICSQYSEESDKSDLGKWRVPNIVEVAMMWTTSLMDLTSANGETITRVGQNISCTHEYFYQFPDNTDCQYAFFGRKDGGKIARSIMQGTKLSSCQILCVRDVK